MWKTFEIVARHLKNGHTSMLTLRSDHERLLGEVLVVYAKVIKTRSIDDITVTTE